MKVVIFTAFLKVAFAFLQQSEFFNEKINQLQLKGRENDHSFFRKAVDSGIKYTEQELLSLILNFDYSETSKCSQHLTSYCDEQKKDNSNLDYMFPEVKTICASITQKCDALKREDKIKAQIKTISGNLKRVSENSSGFLDDCVVYGQECQFYDKGDLNFLKQCTVLRESCRIARRTSFLYEIAYRILSGNLKSQEACKDRLRHSCSSIIAENIELMRLCMDMETTCSFLITTLSAKCTNLESRVKSAVSESSVHPDICHIYLENCHFYAPSCDIKVTTICRKLHKKCKSSGIVYTPPGPGFNPVRKDPSLAETIGLEDLFRSLEYLGIRAKSNLPVNERNMMLVMLSAELLMSSKCISMIMSNADIIVNINLLNSIYDSINKEVTSHGKSLCSTLNTTTTNDAIRLSGLIHNLHLSNDTIWPRLESWQDLRSDLEYSVCSDAEANCFFFQKHYPGRLGNACSNLRAACFKAELFQQSRNVLLKEMRKNEPNKSYLDTSTPHMSVLKACNAIRSSSDPILPMYREVLAELCLYPIKTYNSITSDISRRSRDLTMKLDSKRDFPDEKDCTALIDECDDVEQDLKNPIDSCFTLRQNCRRAEAAKNLEEFLIKEKDKKLQNFELCVKDVIRRCSMWTIKDINRLFACEEPEIICRIMVSDLDSRCIVFRQHMDDMNIAANALNIDNMEAICSLWMPYCDVMVPNCDELAGSSSENSCALLQRNCQDYEGIVALEQQIIDGFKDESSDQTTCKSILNDYCSTNSGVNTALVRFFCGSSTSPNDYTINSRCDKLLKLFNDECLELTFNLIIKSDIIATMLNKSNDLYTKAKEAHSTLNMKLLSEKHSNLSFVRREEIFKDLSDKKIEGLQLITDSLDAYFKLNKECENFLYKCRHLKCVSSRDLCNNISKLCNDIKRLDFSAYETYTKTVKANSDHQSIDPMSSCSSIATTTITSLHTYIYNYTSLSLLTTTSESTQCIPVKCTNSEESERHIHGSAGYKVSSWLARKIFVFIVMFVFI